MIATDLRVPVTILRHPIARLVGLTSRAVVNGNLAAWVNPVTQQSEILPAGSWQKGVDNASDWVLTTPMTSPQYPTTAPFIGQTRNGEIVAVEAVATGWAVFVDHQLSGVFETVEQANVDADLYCPLAA